MAEVKPIPEGYHSVTPYLLVERAAALIEFMKQAFGAQERFRMGAPGDLVGHAEMQVGDSVVMLADAAAGGPEQQPMPAMLHLYVEDVDVVFARALEAGATAVREPEDQFYGDRMGGIQDPTGNQWWISTHVEDVSPEELERRVAHMQH